MKPAPFCYALGVATAMMMPVLSSAAEIHDAARRGDVAAVMHMLDQGAGIEDRDDTAQTPLMVAALGGHSRLVVDLLMRGADATAHNDRGMTVLHAAAFSGDLDSATWLVAAGADFEATDNKFGVTPLIVAAEENRIKLVAYFIGLGANLETAERHGYTALTRSGYKERDAIIRLLLERGAACQQIDPLWQAECVKRKATLGI